MDLNGPELRPVGVEDPKALPESSSLDLVPPVVGDLGAGDREDLDAVFLNLETLG